MEVFLSDLARSGEKRGPAKYDDFKKILEQIEKHPNRKYFIFKSIIVNNLYGVDIMEEAVEICKLRLFLKLVAQVGDANKIEPLPDIDFNIRAGNTLIGYATYDDVKKTVTSKLDFENTMEKIEEKAEDVDRLFKLFHQQQTEFGGEVTPDHKQKLRVRLKALEDELNRYRANEYGIDPNKRTQYEKWLSSHKPFHWFIEFYGIIKSGGFGVIIGNPPYVEYNKIRQIYTIRGYSTEGCGNLYPYVIERSFHILKRNARFGMIVQLPLVCTDRMKPLQKELLEQNNFLWFANFDDRPSRLFDGLEHIRATIVLSNNRDSKEEKVFSTNYKRWYSDIRPVLFDLLTFAEMSSYLMDGTIPKIGDGIAKLIRKRIEPHSRLGMLLVDNSNYEVFFHNAPQYWIRAMDFAPYFWNERNGEQISTQVKNLQLYNKLDAAAAVALLNSSLFYWWFIVLSDCRHLNMREIEWFPAGLSDMSEPNKKKLAGLTKSLMIDLKKNSQRKECFYQTTGNVVYDEFYPKYAKSLIDEIDRVLAKHYGFTDEELDFIINYDIKYRMGRDEE